MKKIIIFMLILLSCNYINSINKTKELILKKVKKEKNEQTDNYLKSQFGNFYYDLQIIKNEREFNDFITFYKRGIIENNNMTDEDKRIILEKIKNLNWEKNVYFYFIIKSREPILASDLNFDFKIDDKNNNNIDYDIYTMSGKFTTILNSITFIDYRYFWLIKKSDQYVIEKENLPINFKILFTENNVIRFFCE